MASKRHIRRKACTGKRRYGSVAETGRAIRQARQRGHIVRAYRCRFCKGIHVGHFKSNAIIDTRVVLK